MLGYNLMCRRVYTFISATFKLVGRTREAFKHTADTHSMEACQKTEFRLKDRKSRIMMEDNRAHNE